MSRYVVHWTRDERESVFHPCTEDAARDLAPKLAQLDGTQLVTLEREGEAGAEVIWCQHVPTWILTWQPGAGTIRYETHRDAGELQAAVGSLEALIAEGDPIVFDVVPECGRCQARMPL